MAEIDRQQARALAEQWLDVYYRRLDMDPVILDAQTMEEAFGWVFFYQSQTWLDTGDPLHVFIGNAPLVVTRDGTVHTTTTGQSIEESLQRFRA